MKYTEKKSVQKIIAAMLVVVTIFGLLSTSSLVTLAYTDKTGTITGGNPYVYTRVRASDSSDRVNTLENGKPLTVIGETTGDDGQLWYQVRYYLKANGKERIGYCRAINVLLDSGSSGSQSPEYESNATVIAKGTITGNNVYVRDGAGTSNTNKLVALDFGHQIDIIGKTEVSGKIWYKHNCTKNGVNYTGWTSGTYVSVEYINLTPDANFEQSLRDMGFPESYISKLSSLHSLYPNWQFVPVHTGLNWNDVIANESASAVNMVQTSADDAKKSIASSEYDWRTNKWTIRDGSGWVTAHPDYISYCMDPRNFINEANIFQFESLSYSSAHTLAGVQAVIKGSFMQNDIANGDGTTLNYANAFMTIGQSTGVSPYHLASRVRQEQGAGTSSLISGTYKGYTGYYNYFNIKASGTPESVLIANGLSHAKSMGWNTRYKSLLGGAEFLASKYIGVGQDTLYFQKFDVISTGGLYWHQYMTNVTAAISEGKSVAKAYTDKTQTFVFKIPVYNNMPAEQVVFNATGNRNNYLKSLSVSGLSLTPTFDGATTNYSIVVDPGVSAIAVSAAPIVSTSTVTGTGTYNLAVGNNTINIYCKSQSGETKTYTINVARPDDGNAQYRLSSGKYAIGAYITGVAPGTTAADFVSGISCEGGSLKLLNSSGAEHTGTVATGNKLGIYVDGALVATKEIVIYGDVNGDGLINILDLIRINRHSIGASVLQGAYLEAGDANRKADGANILDLIIINRHTLGLATIQQ